MNKRIVIIEDDKELRECYSLIIKSVDNYQMVNAYSNCEAAFPNLGRDKPDFILMDIHLAGGISGIEGTRYIKSKNPFVEVVIISAFDDQDLVLEALRAGAFGYLTKSNNFLELIYSLDELSKGGAPMSAKVSRLVVNQFHNNPNTPLSERETQVIKLMAQGYSYSEIADALFISKETSKSHIKNVYSKLGVNTKSAAIEKARDNKFI